MASTIDWFGVGVVGREVGPALPELFDRCLQVGHGRRGYRALPAAESPKPDAAGRPDASRWIRR